MKKYIGNANNMMGNVMASFGLMGQKIVSTRLIGGSGKEELEKPEEGE